MYSRILKNSLLSYILKLFPCFSQNQHTIFDDVFDFKISIPNLNIYLIHILFLYMFAILCRV